MKLAVKPPPPPLHGLSAAVTGDPQSTPQSGVKSTMPATKSRPTPGRSLVAVEDPLPPEVVAGSGRTFIESPLKQILLGVNARAISPRAIQALSHDLYAGGVLTWDEYAALAFQAELHPDFGRTIGALTGETPLPDQPRDFVKEWENRLDFERRYFPERPERDTALHILSVLRRIDAPTDLKA